MKTTMTNIFILGSLVLLSGCATVRPQARVIDATNKEPIFSRSVEKGTKKQKKKETGGVFGDRAKFDSKERKTTFDFTF